MPKIYDLICIGGGSGGFNGARTAAALGKKVAIIDGAKELGGLCILRGCMPSKTLIYAAEILHLAQNGKKFGLRIPSAKVNMHALHARKKRIIGDFAAHRQEQLINGRFDLYRTHAHFISPNTLELADGTQVSANKFLIATGSKVAKPAITGLSDIPALTSDEILDLNFVPKSVIVLGGGIVACELAQYLNRIGSKVTLIQRSKNILRDHSPAASAIIQETFLREGIDLHTSTTLERISRTAKGVVVVFKTRDATIKRHAEYCFNALGRIPNTHHLDLQVAGVETKINGQIVTNRWQQTTQPHIYAAGDCCGPHEIVHLAVAQGELAARHAFRIKNIKPINNDLLLNVVFTDPQLATIGKLESELKKSGIEYLTASYPFNDHGKSILMEANYGYVKVIATLAEIVTYPLEEIAEQI